MLGRRLEDQRGRRGSRRCRDDLHRRGRRHPNSRTGRLRSRLRDPAEERSAVVEGAAVDLAVASLAVRLAVVAELVQQPEQLVDSAEHFELTQNRSFHSFYVRRLRTGNCRALF